MIRSKLMRLSDHGGQAQYTLKRDRQSPPCVESCEVANLGPKPCTERETVGDPKRADLVHPMCSSPTRDEVRRTVTSPEFAISWEDGNLRTSMVGIVPDGILESLPKRRKNRNAGLQRHRQGKTAPQAS